MSSFTMGPQAPELRLAPKEKQRLYLCDRCGFEMIEHNCKIVCPNCGSRYDCSDLSIYFDEPQERNGNARQTP